MSDSASPQEGPVAHATHRVLPPMQPNRSVAGLLNNRRAQASTPIPPSLQAKMAAFARRSQQSPVQKSVEEKSVDEKSVDAAAEGIARVSVLDRTPARAPASPPGPARPGAPTGGGLAARRKLGGVPKLNANDIAGGIHLPPLGAGPQAAGLGVGRPMQDEEPRRPQNNFATPFSNFGKIVDPSGALNFSGKAIVHASGVNFSNGSSFSINMSQMQLEDELGKGAYGTVKKVLHKPTNVAMAMKEIRLELDDSKLNAIIMELDILHRAVAPEIVEFYGAFFIESCVYYCMEYMDAGSLDKLQGAGIPEDVLGRITASMVRGLKFLKDELQIIHRDVKPTNVLVNRKGNIKLCDFGVSGQLERSLAKTNIGCQSYMAPERIKGESQNNVGTYTVSSDVWSLGLSMIEMAIGRYPYPPETYANVFAQLTAIVHGDPPELPETYSETCRDFVARCLHKVPEMRATYAELLEHPFLKHDREQSVDMPGWVAGALEYREKKQADDRQQRLLQEATSAPPSS
ncbi:kinase-like protein [Wolfiporia cocos MD-104 SS10]|uniref:mitogen-activated protein kinase kinase n=1 Tax=Wolfiporia cocos (strain MD-104) TaxID=742152 RepID=A0A2H3JV16_WOLCO|nr:kinase-like protein [Wolfiporia cocos MD-104 SS10]